MPTPSTSGPADPERVQRLGRAVAQRSVELDEPFLANDHWGTSSEQPYQISIAGPVLFSAVHSVRHHRRSQARFGESYTAGVALAFAELADCSCAVVADGRHPTDANSDPEHPLKLGLGAALDAARAGGQAVRYLIDLHGMNDKRGFDVALGPGIEPGSRLRALLADALTRRGLVVDPAGEATGFRAAQPATMVRWAQSLGLEAVQVEAGHDARSARRDRAKRAEFVEALAEVVLALGQRH